MARSPTTTGKIERFHQTLQQECLTGRVFATLADAAAPPVHGTEHRGTLTISLHDQTGRLVLTCALHRAWVSSYDVFAELDADAGEPDVERYPLCQRDRADGGAPAAGVGTSAGQPSRPRLWNALDADRAPAARVVGGRATRRRPLSF